MCAGAGVESLLRGLPMITSEKFQKGRMWAYAAGVVIFVVVVLVKFIAR